MEPPWLVIARQSLGLAEIPGKDTAPAISRWLIELKAWWRDDETPWCGTFVAHCFREAGIELPQHWYRARAWLDWGSPLYSTEPSLDHAAIGCVAVFERKGGGHVGFVVGLDRRGNLMVLGGNQGNRVSIAAFPPERVLGYRWPYGVDAHNYLAPLPIYEPRPVSASEA